MKNVKGKEINLCPNIKENCIWNSKERINTNSRPEKCYNCLKK